MNEERAGWIVTFEVQDETYYASKGGEGTRDKITAIVHKTPEQAIKWCNLFLNRWYWDTVVLEHVTLIYGKMIPVTLNEIDGSL